MMWTELAMLVLQAVAFAEASWNGQANRAMYWLGAFVLTIAVIRGT
jgi:hypothetical protein